MSLCKICLVWPTSICSQGHCQSIYLNSSFTLQLVYDMCKCTLLQKFSTATILKLVSRWKGTPWNNTVMFKICYSFGTNVFWLKIHVSVAIFVCMTMNWGYVSLRQLWVSCIFCLDLLLHKQEQESPEKLFPWNLNHVRVEYSKIQDIWNLMQHEIPCCQKLVTSSWVHAFISLATWFTCYITLCDIWLQPGVSSLHLKIFF